MGSTVTLINAQLLLRFKIFALITGISVIMLGLVIVLGWIIDNATLKLAGWGMVQGSNALALILAGTSLFLVMNPKRPLYRLGQALAFIVCLSGLLTFIENLSGIDLGLNHMWYQPSPDSIGLTFPGPMAPNVGLTLMLLGAGLMIFRVSNKNNIYPFQYLVLAGCLFSVIALIGYSSGVGILCTLIGCIKMPFMVSLALTLLCAAAIFAEPERGLTAVFLKESIGGKLARSLTFLIVLTLPLLWLKTWGEKSGLYEPSFGWAIFALTFVILLLICVGRNVKSLNALEIKHESVQNELDKAINSPDINLNLKTKRVCLECLQEFPEQLGICPNDGSPLNKLTEDPFVGTVLADRYKMLSLLGKGGLSSVYKAQHCQLGKMFAIKIIHAYFMSDVITVKRFQLEAKSLGKLSHRNLIAVQDFGITTRGLPYLVMDFVEGIDLAHIIFKKPLEIERALPIFMQLCDGLEHAHSQGIIHRDLKPSNIMIVRENGHEIVKIIDFGLAKSIAVESQEKLTATGSVFGSPQYMSPEQCLGRKADHRSDIYSLGCLMYECVTGKPPFDSDSPVEILTKQLAEEPPAFPESANLPGWLKAEIFTALRKDPAHRQQSASQLKEALAAGFQKGRSVV